MVLNVPNKLLPFLNQEKTNYMLIRPSIPKKIKNEFVTIEQDEIGHCVMFMIPLAALYYDHWCVTLKAQDKVDDTVDELVEMFYGLNEN